MNRERRVRSTYPEAKACALEIKEAAAAYGVECDVVNVREAMASNMGKWIMSTWK